MRSNGSQRGFTLLEMMLALTIFALISLAGWQILQTMQRSQQQTREHQQQLTELARAFALIEHDLQHALIPIEAVTQRKSTPAFQAGNGPLVLKLTRRNWLNPQSQARSALQHVAWRIDAQQLSRVNLSASSPALTFPSISKATLRFYTAGRWQTEWNASFALPEAIEITLRVQGWGDVTRLFRLEQAG
ncbi:type II secretion system protein GspJ [Enterobacterales bacterium CwR94]|nr:type II secretion system protein GspJ [Enterobacterales bacterium CwR94]